MSVTINHQTNSVEPSSGDLSIGGSGNVLVGKTSSAFGTAGIEIDGANDRIWVTRSGAEPLVLNRLTNDGNLLEFYKDGATVGSIGVVANDRLYIATDDSANAGLAFDGDNSRIYACTSVGNTSDNTTDLGSETQRFKDLYLSGGVYLGGTGAANKLDDYEEGTWTPTLEGSTTNPTVSYGNRKGYYTKIGNQVTAHCFVSGTFSGGSGGVRIAGLPFNTGPNVTYSTHIWFEAVDITDGFQLTSYIPTNDDTVRLYEIDISGSGNDNAVLWSEVIGIECRFSFTYQVA